MSSRTGWLRAGIAAIVIGFVAAILIARSYRVAAEQRTALASFSSQIGLGMPRHAVDAACKRACVENPEWTYISSVDAFGAPMALVETPLTFGAKNWVVYIVFESDVVAAVLVRIEDTPRLRPNAAPGDRVRDVSAHWLAGFTPD